MSPDKVTTTDKAAATDLPERKRLDEFTSKYANNVFLESTNWDLKLLFGEFDVGENTVLMHSAMTLPWTQVKILAYLLHIHIAAHEAEFGRIVLPKNAVLEIPEQMPKELAETSSDGGKSWPSIRRLYENFITANPEIVGAKK
jgi:hypothetical protein